jgi:hypothetical protein
MVGLSAPSWISQPIVLDPSAHPPRVLAQPEERLGQRYTNRLDVIGGIPRTATTAALTRRSASQQAPT